MTHFWCLYPSCWDKSVVRRDDAYVSTDHETVEVNSYGASLALRPPSPTAVRVLGFHSLV